MHDLSVSEIRIWSGQVIRTAPMVNNFRQPVHGQGIYVEVPRDPGSGPTFTLRRIRVCGSESRAYQEAGRMAERRDHPLGLAGTRNAILSHLGIDAVYLGGDRLIVLNRRVLRPDTD